MREDVMRVGLIVILASLGYLLFWPVPMIPEVSNGAKPPGLVGIYAPNYILDQATIITLPGGAFA